MNKKLTAEEQKVLHRALMRSVEIIQTWKCWECGEECCPVEVIDDYSNGNAGTHHTGNYVSDCCHADYEEVL